MRFARVAAAVVVASGAGALVEFASASPKPPLVESVSLSPGFYGLGVDHGNIAVTTGAAANDCGAQLFDRSSLRRVRTVSTCVGWGLHTSPVVVTTDHFAFGIHVAIANPVTHKTSAGPLLFTIDNWSWAHSGVAAGGGNVWIWSLTSKSLVEASAATGRIEHRWSVDAGGNPWMAVNADGFWMTDSVWGGPPSETKADLWHVAPGSGQLSVARRLASTTEWFEVTESSLYLDELTPVNGGYQQSIWRLDGSDAKVSYETRATLLPAPDFGLTGYIVEGNAQVGFVTLSQIGRGQTPVGIGDCDSSAPMRIVRIDPTTGRQSYIATLPSKDARGTPECDFEFPGEEEFYDGALYLLAGTERPGNYFGVLVRVSI